MGSIPIGGTCNQTSVSGPPAELLLTQDREQRELVGGLAAWGRSQYEQGLSLVLGEQDLAVELDLAQLGMDQGFVVLEAGGDFLPLPDLGELRADLPQLADQRART